ncbi:MAG: hypothetical protein KF819_18595 [Labilithrix sp.]|nr:hypothetical protein [Labilithrix sp.]
MLKAFATSTLALATCAVVFVACSDKNESEFQDQPPLFDGGPDQISALVPDSNLPDGKEAGPESCPPAIPSDFNPTWTAPTKSAACSTEQLGEYFDNCIADPSKTEPSGECATWKAAAANDACGKCAEAADNTGPIQWYQSRTFFTLNVAGCISLTQPPGGGCAEAYNAAVQCSRESCNFCFGLGGTFDQFRTCQGQVQTQGICKSYETAQSSACPSLTSSTSPSLPCFKTSAESAQAHFTRVVGIFCGP